MKKKVCQKHPALKKKKKSPLPNYNIRVPLGI